MAGLYVPLDVNYYEDDKIMSVPPTAELLYIRSLAFAKRTRTDGLLADWSLTAFGLRIAHRRTAARLLVDAGLWTRNGDGWYITGWLKHNSPMVNVTGIRADAGAMGAHIRWHVNRNRVDPGCEHCREQAGLG